MNDVIRLFVALLCCALVCALGAAAVHIILGQWSLLAWVALGFALLMGVMRRVNA